MQPFQLLMANPDKAITCFDLIVVFIPVHPALPQSTFLALLSLTFIVCLWRNRGVESFRAFK